MDVSKPIVFKEHLQLSSLGVRPASISFQTLTLESDHFICVREEVGEQNQVVIIDLTDANSVLRRPITADSAIMHPRQKILALKSGRTLQIFNIETKTKVKSNSNAEEVTFWKWISDNTVGIVTETAVYHWTTADATSPPQKVFDRHPILSGAQIINYRCSADERWLVLVGVSGNSTNPSAFKIKGWMQLYSRDRGVSQPIEGHAAAFSELELDGNQHPTKLFTYSVRTGAGAKLHIVEIDHQAPDPAFIEQQVDVYFPPEATNDFPVAMQVSKKHGIIYLVTKYGFIHLYDLESGTCIYMNRISGETIFVTAEHEASHGIICVNKKGQVLSVDVDENTIVPYILAIFNNTELAFKLASRANLPGADDLYVQQYQQFFQSGQFDQAAQIAANSPRGILRNSQIIDQLKQAPVVPGGQSPILRYFDILLQKGQLNHLESIELSRPVLQQGKKNLFEKWLKEGKLTCSEELGDMVRLNDKGMALNVYLRANALKKVATCFAEMGKPEKMRTNPEKGAEFAAQLANDESGSLVDIECSPQAIHATVPQMPTPSRNRTQKKRVVDTYNHESPHALRPVLGSSILVNSKVPTWKRLCSGAFPPPEVISLAEAIFTSKDEVRVVCNLRGDDAQAFVDATHKVCFAHSALGHNLITFALAACWLPNSNLCRLGSESSRSPITLVGELSKSVVSDMRPPGIASQIIANTNLFQPGQHQGRDVAVKVLRVYSNSNIPKITSRFCKEVVTWNALRHPNVLPFLGVTMGEDQFSMVSEWMIGGNINEFVKVHREVNRFELLQDVAMGLIYMHNQAMIHGDLKGANILIDQNQRACLADFGLLTIVSDPGYFTASSVAPTGGTTRWMSPELLDPEHFGLDRGCPTKESDCYALGMVIYEVLSGQMPFAQSREYTIARKVVNGERPERPGGAIGAWFPDNLWQMLNMCWATQAQNRVSVEEVLGGLEKLSSTWTPLPPVMNEDTEMDEITWDGLLMTSDRS